MGVAKGILRAGIEPATSRCASDYSLALFQLSYRRMSVFLTLCNTSNSRYGDAFGVRVFLGKGKGIVPVE